MIPPSGKEPKSPGETSENKLLWLERSGSGGFRRSMASPLYRYRVGMLVIVILVVIAQFFSATLVIFIFRLGIISLIMILLGGLLDL